MTKDEAIKFWEGQLVWLRRLGITRDAVHKWKKYPPIDKQFQIMVLSGGRLSVTEDNTKETKTDE